MVSLCAMNACYTHNSRFAECNNDSQWCKIEQNVSKAKTQSLKSNYTHIIYSNSFVASAIIILRTSKQMVDDDHICTFDCTQYVLCQYNKTTVQCVLRNISCFVIFCYLTKISNWRRRKVTFTWKNESQVVRVIRQDRKAWGGFDGEEIKGLWKADHDNIVS